MTTTKQQLHQELKHKFVIQRLMKMGVRESQTGKPIHECDYEECKYELVLASFRQIDAETDAGRWF
jgi:hypothetical protein